MRHPAIRAGLLCPQVSSLVLVFTLAVALFPPSVLATTAVGRTPGAFAVSPTGAASYTIPIWAPRGPNGLQPHVALAYNSQQGNGYLGVGWGLTGLSAIYRCNLTFAEDAAPAAVSLSTSDGLCLDGQRLRLTSGTYGAAGSTYQTEIANFSNVTASGTAGNGPAYFTVQGRDGLTHTYGNGGNSQVLATGTTTALAWMLNAVSDRAGNTMTIAYNTATGSAVPATISWTPSSHGSSTYNYTMTFTYGANVPQSSFYGYAAGTVVTNTNLLSAITIAYSGTTVKKYVLTYQTSPTTGRDELKQVQECADSGATNCLPPTVITYQAGAAGVSTTGTTAVSASSGSVYSHYDFNGDGYPDLIYQNGSTWYVAFGSASGYGTPISTGISSSTKILAGDLLGNGQDRILANNGGTWYYYTWNGTSFTPTSTGFAYDSAATQYVLADVDGDGLPDLIKLRPSTPGFSIYISRNTGNGTSVAFAAAVDAYDIYSATSCNTVVQIASNSDQANTFGNLHSFDFNGDGRQDIVTELVLNYPQGERCVPPYTTQLATSELISNGNSFTAHVIATSTNAALPPVTFLNWNSDACTDFMGYNSIIIAGCNGSTPTTLQVPGTVVGAMDWDGDGRTDLLVQNGTNLGVYLSTGNGIGSLVSTSIPYSSTTTYFTFDANGDGLDDFGYRTSSGVIGYYKHNGAGQPPDLVSSVTDGYGNSASPTYVSLVQNNYTEHSGTEAAYPYKDFIGPMYVVSNVTLSDPTSTSGGTYSNSFAYTGAWTNLQGLGLQSFYTVEGTDSRNGLHHWQYFERSFPYTGMKFDDLIANATFYPTQTVNTLAPLVTLSQTQYQQRYFAYFSNTTTSQKEVGGTENGDLITTTSTNYTFDNYGNATSIATTVTDKDPGSPYNGQAWTATTTNTPDVDTTHWCLGLFTETQVAYTGPSGSNAVTRTKTMTPDTTNCRYTEIITEPNSSLFKVTEDLTYDSFGNIQTDKLTGAAMGTASPAVRTTTINWTTSTATTGQFPMNVTDPSGAQTQFNYNFSYGLPSSLTDPNSSTQTPIVTTWLYTDGFGRKTQETRPDGTYTTWAYSSCASAGGCLIGNSTLAVIQTVYNTNATVQTDATTFFDELERPLLAKSRMLASGTYARNEVRYDNLGRTVQQAMPCTWSAVTTTCTYWTTSSYDVVNRVSQTQRPISSTNSTLQTTTFAYAGRTTTVTDPQTNAKTTVADVNGWLRQTKDAYGYVVTTLYDAAGSKTGATDSAGNTLWSGTYNYGLAAFPATATDMDLGAWSYTVDALGEVTGWRDAKTQSFAATYDALSRPITRTEPDLFTQWTWGSIATNHNIGQLQSVCTGTGNTPTNCTGAPGYSETETYDSVGRPYQRTITIPGQPNTFIYTRLYSGTTGLLDTLTYPVSTSSYALQLKYGYQNRILQTVTDVSDTPNVALWTANATNPMGQVTQETLGNGIVTNKTYDAVTHWLGAATSGVSGGSGVKNLAFLYDEMGNVTQRQDNNLGLTENVYYDNDYRFSYSKLNGTQNLSVSYDNTGNITSRSDVAGGATWTYDTVRKHAVTQAGSSAYQYAYDANGNANARQGSSITWASYNYPTSISAGSGSTAETVSLSHGPDRQRWQQTYTGNGTTETTTYVGGLMDMVASGGVLDYRHYIYAGSEAVAVYSRKSPGPNTFSYLLSDHQASVASITNSSGVQVIGESFDQFGNRRNPTTWSGPASNSDLTTIAGITRQGYTLQTALGLWMGLNHMNGRVQDAVTGRFLSSDPNIPDPSYAQSYNRFSYVNNNPLSYTDPSGFEDAALPINDPLQGEIVVTGRRDAQFPSTGTGVGGNGGGGGRGSSGESGGLETVTVTGHQPNQPQGQPQGTPLQEVVVTGTRTQSPIQAPPLFAQEILFGTGSQWFDPLQEAIQKGYIDPRNLGKMPNYGTKVGVPEPTPPVVPQVPWAIRAADFIGRLIDDFNGVKPTAPPACPTPYCA
jgi:RHS repeat-associated protein